MIKVLIPYHLQTLAGTGPELELELEAGSPATARSLLRTLESTYPTLRGAIIDHASGLRRPKIRFFACREDISHDSMDTPLPDEVVSGQEPFIILGAISGG